MNQRAQKGKLSPDRVKRLDSLGFSWSLFIEDWEAKFASLEEFHQREGHCRVPKSDKESGGNLARWVQRQRSNKKRLTPDQLKRLNSLGFVWKA